MKKSQEMNGVRANHMREMQTVFVSKLAEMGVPNSTTRPCFLVIHEGRATVVETPGCTTLGLEDLYAAPEKVGAKRFDTVGHIAVGETWEGRAVDLWFDDEGLYDEDRQPTLIGRRSGNAICGPVVVTSSNTSGETVPLTVEEALAMTASGNLWWVLARGLPWQKPEPGFKVVSFDRGLPPN